jgi:hypothetical protein
MILEGRLEFVRYRRTLIPNSLQGAVSLRAMTSP